MFVHQTEADRVLTNEILKFLAAIISHPSYIAHRLETQLPELSEDHARVEGPTATGVVGFEATDEVGGGTLQHLDQIPELFPKL